MIEFEIDSFWVITKYEKGDKQLYWKLSPPFSIFDLKSHILKGDQVKCINSDQKITLETNKNNFYRWINPGMGYGGLF